MKSLKRILRRKKDDPKQEEGDVVSPKEPESEVKETVHTETTMAETTTEGATSTDASCKVYVVFYSMYGHIYQMAQAVKKGIDSVEGCQGILYQVRETLPEEVLTKMHAPPKPDVPIIEAAELANASGIVFGFPTRFGMMCAQMKALFDATGSLWQSGGLAGKPAAMFTSTGGQVGGQETTIMTAVTQLAHHAMIYVPIGYVMGGPMFGVQNVRGGGPWGAGTLADLDGSRQPSKDELAVAEFQGSYFAGKAKLLCS